MRFLVVFLLPSSSHPAAPSAFQIIFENRLDAHDVGNDCLMSIDGTDYKIKQKGAAKKGNASGSHKYTGKSSLRYKLGIDILAGNLVWVGGPYPPGAWPDIKIFMHELAHLLKQGERVEADNGYVGHPNKIKCPNNDCNPEENLAMQACVRS